MWNHALVREINRKGTVRLELEYSPKLFVQKNVHFAFLARYLLHESKKSTGKKHLEYLVQDVEIKIN